MSKYYIGIDGGGTKTDFLICDNDLTPIRQLTLGGCNPNDIGMERCISVLRRGLNQLTEGLDSNQIVLFAGISGGTTGNNQKKIWLFLTRDITRCADRLQ